MAFDPIVFTCLLKPVSRRRFAASVEPHNGDAYDKNFSSWDHLVALEAVWDANGHHPYHPGAGRIVRSTLSDASGRRPATIFAETFSDLARLAGRQMRRAGEDLVQLRDSSPIPLGQLHAGRAFNGRINGAKLHLV